LRLLEGLISHDFYSFVEIFQRTERTFTYIFFCFILIFLPFFWAMLQCLPVSATEPAENGLGASARLACFPSCFWSIYIVLIERKKFIFFLVITVWR
jgi:hypothetical protein